MTKENDIVLIYIEDNPFIFARIEDISPDVKENWYRVKLLFLQIPVQEITWILRDIYIDGADFTMDGKKMRLEKVVSPTASREIEEREEGEKIKNPSKEAKVISLAELKKK
ncbi:MAG: hypothetical protein JW786_04640 [Desulfobacterales bacterium]|nr:hypothetical protein [Desulfobacterales bacterium]